MNVMDSDKINSILKLFNINSKDNFKKKSDSKKALPPKVKIASKVDSITPEDSLLSKITNTKNDYKKLRLQIENIEKIINDIKK
jgi:hypothetical protein